MKHKSQPIPTLPTDKSVARKSAIKVGIRLLGSLSIAFIGLSGTQAAGEAAIVIGEPDGNANIGSLPDGNYRFCSDTTTLSDTLFFREENGPPPQPVGSCFRFRKQAEQVVGEYYYPARGASVCFTGRVSGNVLTGEAIERLPVDGALPDSYAQGGLTPWRAAGLLEVGQGQAINRSGASGDPAVIRYEIASLNLDNFYRYNAGRVVPPTDCTVQPSRVPFVSAALGSARDVGSSAYYNQPIYLDESSVRAVEAGVYTYTTFVGAATPLNVTEYRVDCLQADEANNVEVGAARVMRSRYYDSDGDLQAIEGSNIVTTREAMVAAPAYTETLLPDAASRYVCEEYAQVTIPEAILSAPESEPAEPEPAEPEPAEPEPAEPEPVTPPSNPESGSPDPTTAPITIPTEVEYKRYRNERFDYSVLYPAELLSPHGDASDRGETFFGSNGDIEMSVYGTDIADSPETLTQLYEQAQANITVTYQTLEDDFFVVSGTNDGDVFYRKTFLENDSFKTLELRYDQNLRREFEPIASVIGDSFAPVQTGSDLAQLPPEVQTAIIESASNNTEAESAIFAVVAVESRTWSDGCLGLPREGEVCTQALVPGWRVRVEAELAGGIRTFTYRTDETGAQLRFE